MLLSSFKKRVCECLYWALLICRWEADWRPIWNAEINLNSEHYLSWHGCLSHLIWLKNEKNTKEETCSKKDCYLVCIYRSKSFICPKNAMCIVQDELRLNYKKASYPPIFFYHFSASAISISRFLQPSIIHLFLQFENNYFDCLACRLPH